MAASKNFGKIAPADPNGYPQADTLDGTETVSFIQGGIMVTDTLQAIADLAPAGGTPGGVDTQVQFNDAGSFGGDAGLAYNKTTDTLSGVHAVLSGRINEAKGADIASAATTDIGAATGNFVHITGTTTITALGTVQAGTRRIVRFAGALILTHNATSLILPTGANITTAANDVAEFVSEGSGNWRCTGYLRATGSALAGGGGLTNWTDAVNTAAPNATTPVTSLTATNAATNVDAAIIAKGSGATLAQVPNNLGTGGNKRGTYATDWQKSRSNATEVASGSWSFIGGGDQNTASGNYSAVPSGQGCTASGNHAWSGGSLCVASGSQSFVFGGSSTASGANAFAFGTSSVANADISFITGQNGSARALFGARCHAIATGQQRFQLLLRRQTTNATPTALTTTNAAATAANQFAVPGNRACNVEGRVTARDTSTGASKSWRFDALVKNIANVTSLEGAVTPAVLYANAAASTWTIAIAADDANDVMTVTATGEAGKTIDWTCDLHSVET